MLDKARAYYKDLLKKYPETKAAGEAKKTLKELDERKPMRRTNLAQDWPVP